MVRATYWTGWVEANNGNGTAWSLIGRSMAAALEDGIRMATFAAGNGYKPTIRMTEVCADCDGKGKTCTPRRRNPYASKPCKHCNGLGELTTLPVIHFQQHKNTTIQNYPPA